MIHLKEIVEVPRPRADAFAYVADFTTTMEWDPGISHAEQLSPEGPGLDCRYEVTAVFNGNERRLTYVTEVYEPPERVVFRGGDRRFESVDTITFETMENGTRIIYAADFRMKGLLAVLEPMLRNRFQKVARKGASGLAAALEGIRVERAV